MSHDNADPISATVYVHIDHSDGSYSFRREPEWLPGWTVEVPLHVVEQWEAARALYEVSQRQMQAYDNREFACRYPEEP